MVECLVYRLNDLFLEEKGNGGALVMWLLLTPLQLFSSRFRERRSRREGGGESEIVD